MRFIQKLSTILILICSSEAISAERCLKGSIPSPQTLEAAEFYVNKIREELSSLQLLSAQNPKNDEIKSRLKQKTDLMFKDVSLIGELWESIKLPQPLEHCSEFKLLNEEIADNLQLWKIMSLSQPSNQNYAYNHKLYTMLLMKKI